jgi:hypothetical protein
MLVTTYLNGRLYSFILFIIYHMLLEILKNNMLFKIFHIQITYGDPKVRMPHLTRSIYSWKIVLYAIRKCFLLSSLCFTEYFHCPHWFHMLKCCSLSLGQKLICSTCKPRLDFKSSKSLLWSIYVLLQIFFSKTQHLFILQSNLSVYDCYKLKLLVKSVHFKWNP